MKIMAFDYGTKRIGIAVADPMQILPSGLDTIHPNHHRLPVKITYQTERVGAFIVGEPKRMDNTPPQSAPHVRGLLIC